MSSSSASSIPIFYSFRRCPYAMRARMALSVSAQTYVIREVSLRDKPAALLAASPKATIPVLVLPDGRVLDESLDIMRWALAQHDPKNWLAAGDSMFEVIACNDGPFKFHLDRMKYANRYADSQPAVHRAEAIKWLALLEARLADHNYLFGSTSSLADVAIFPFVRQFAHADAAAFADLPFPGLQLWLSGWEASVLFQSVMAKYRVWQPGDEDVYA